jgi:hypothetical protein
MFSIVASGFPRSKDANVPFIYTRWILASVLEIEVVSVEVSVG